MSFITYDRSVHFYSLPEGASQPTQLTVCDVDDVFLPSPTDILVNLQENNGLVRQLLEALPEMFANSYSTESALGAALQVKIFQCSCNICGPQPSNNTVGANTKIILDSLLFRLQLNWHLQLAGELPYFSIYCQH